MNCASADGISQKALTIIVPRETDTIAIVRAIRVAEAHGLTVTVEVEQAPKPPRLDVQKLVSAAPDIRNPEPYWHRFDKRRRTR